MATNRNPNFRTGAPVTSTMVQAQSAGAHTELSSFVFQDKETAAALSRLTSSRTPANFDNKGNRTISKPNTNDLLSISSSIAQHANDAESILFLFSDVRVACEILISSIRSPNDMYEGEVNFDVKADLHVAPLVDKLMPLVKSYFTDVYPLSDKFEKFLRSCLFGEGSAPVLVMPENSLSDLIYGSPNISVESDGTRKPERKRYAKENLTKFIQENSVNGEFSLESLGAWGAGKDATAPKTALERFGLGTLTAEQKKLSDSFKDDKGMTHKITTESLIYEDNPKAIQFRDLVELTGRSMRAEAMERVNDHSGQKTFNDRELAQLLYRKTTGRRQEFLKVKTDKELKRYSVGRPFIFELPPESVIPVINKARANDPVGFIVLIDREGAFLSRLSESSQFESLKQAKNGIQQPNGNGGYGDMSSYLLNKTASVFGTTCEEVTMRQVNTVFTQILEADFAARFRTSYMGSEVTVSDIKRMAELMLFRMLSNLQTQMLFIPADMMVYFAHDYRSNGTGKNLLEESMTVSSMRAQLLFARVMGAVKNAIGRQTVNVEIDPDDPDAQRTFDTIKSEAVMARQQNTAPISVNTSDVINQIQAMSLDFQVTGNESMPSTKITYAESQSNYAKPDDELARELTDLMINHIGVPPEMIEEARRSDFATVAIANNILFSKRVRDMQRKFDPFLTRLVNIMLLADSTFIIEIKKVILENIDVVLSEHEDLANFGDNTTAKVDFLCSEFISNIVAFLAQPDAKSIENNLEALNKRSEMIEAALEFYFSSTVLSKSALGEVGFESVEDYRNFIKAALMRNWISTTNICPEIAEIFSLDKDKKRMLDVAGMITSHAANAAQLVLDIREPLGRIANASTVEQAKLPPAPVANDVVAGGGGSFGGGGDSSFEPDTSMDDFSPDTGNDGGFGDGFPDMDIPEG